MLTLPAATTALVLIDLQNGIVGMQTAPRDVQAVLASGKALAEKFRAAGAPVVLVNVAFSPGLPDALKAPVDQPPHMPAGGPPPTWSELAEGLAQPGDILITKRQWGAFYVSEAAATHGGAWPWYDASLPWTTSLSLASSMRPLLQVVVGAVAVHQSRSSRATLGVDGLSNRSARLSPRALFRD